MSLAGRDVRLEQMRRHLGGDRALVLHGQRQARLLDPRGDLDCTVGVAVGDGVGQQVGEQLRDALAITLNAVQIAN